jgi:branched-chain amino acid transport system substrate-binding protein
VFAATVGFRRSVRAMVLAGVAALTFVGCGASGESGSEQAASAPETIRIGATLPLTGAESRAGGLFRQGYELAIRRQNAAGGITLDKFDGARAKVELVLHDDRTDQRSVVSLTRRLIDRDRVDAMLGTYSTTLSNAQAPVAEAGALPYVNGGGASTPIYRPEGTENKWIFGVISSITSMSQLTADWIAHQQDEGKLPKPLKVALLPENTAHGEDYASGLRDWIEQNPGRIEIVLDEAFEENTSDFTGLLGRVKAANADALLVDAHLPDFVNMQRTYETLGLDHLVLTYGARGSEAEAKEALGSATDYILSAQWWSPLLTSDASRQFVEDFKTAYGNPPEWYSALAYDAAMVLMAAIEEAGTTDKDAVRQALTEIDYSPALLPGGHISFPADNGYQVTNPFVVTQNMPDGSTEIVWPSELQTAEGLVPER